MNPAPYAIALRRHGVWVAVLCLAAAALRLPAVSWGLRDGSWNQPDEQQHVGIAINGLQRLAPDRVDGLKPKPQWNARGLGYQIALVAWARNPRGPWTPEGLRRVGRHLSVVYGVLAVLLVYGLVAGRFRSPAAGGLAALLLASADLHVTYSHYAVPETAHTFWFLACAVLLLHYGHGNRRTWIKLALGCAIGQCVALKLDPTPAIAFVAVLPFMRERAPATRVADLLAVGITALATLGLSWGTLDVRVLLECLRNVAAKNVDAVEGGSPLLHNPVLYFAAAAAGSCFLVVAAAMAGAVRTCLRPAWRRPVTFIPMAGMPALCLALYWTGDVTLVRRALLFFPFMVVAGVLALAWIPRPRLRLGLAVFMVLYSTALAIISQGAFRHETRDRALAFLRTHIPPGTTPTIVYTKYVTPLANVPSHSRVLHRGRQRSISATHAVDYIVMHEAYYARYDKSFTTPFRIPRTCKEVYHGDCAVFALVQSILSGEGGFRLLKAFEAKHPFPERVLFKALFGTYESFLGDTRIYVPAAAPG